MSAVFKALCGGLILAMALPLSAAEVRLIGSIESQYDVELIHREGGQVVDVVVEEGDLVSVDQPMVQFDSRLAQTALESAALYANDSSVIDALDAQLRSADKQYQRYRKAAGGMGSITASDVENALMRAQQLKTEMANAVREREKAKLEMTQWQQRLDDLTVKSPIEGFVAEVMVEKGQWVKPGEVLARIVDHKARFFEVGVPQNQWAMASSDRTFEVLLGGQKIPVTFSHASAVPDKQNQQRTFYFSIPDSVDMSLLGINGYIVFNS